MNAKDLNNALNGIEDAYLQEVDTPDKEIVTMNVKKRTLRILIAAALICLLSASAYAAEQLRVTSLLSGKSVSSENYSDVRTAEKRTGLKANVPEQFQNGFRFQKVETEEGIGADDSGNQVLTYWELKVNYANDRGQSVSFVVHENLGELPQSERVPTEQRTIGGLEVTYCVDHYKLVPENYQLSEEEEQWARQPGNFISYGADTVVETSFANLSWETEDGAYALLDWRAALDADTLFAMAEEIIAK